MTRVVVPKESPRGAKAVKAAVAYVMKMTPELAQKLWGKYYCFLRLPRRLDVGSRVFLKEFDGLPTGRADVCEIISYTDHGLACVRRSCSWSREAPEDLKSLSFELSDEVFPVCLEAEAQAA